MGTASVIGSVGNIIGEVVAMGVLFPLTANMNPFATFRLASAVVAALAVVMLFAIKEPKLRSDSPEEDEDGEDVLMPTNQRQRFRNDAAKPARRSMSESDFKKASFCRKIKNLT